MDSEKPRRAINMKQLRHKLGGASRSKVKRLLNDATINFPKPFRMTDSHNAPLLWWDDEVDEHMLARPRVVTIGDVPRMGFPPVKSESGT